MPLGFVVQMERGARARSCSPKIHIVIHLGVEIGVLQPLDGAFVQNTGGPTIIYYPASAASQKTPAFWFRGE